MPEATIYNWSPTPLGEWLVRITAWLSFACYLFFLAQWLHNRKRLHRRMVTWTIGLVIFLIHLAFAFHYYHQWSHASAFARTQHVTGFGYGVFVSYAFTLLWLLDVLWYWFWPIAFTTRPRWLTIILHLFFAFLWINGTIPYALWPTMLLGIAAWLSLLGYGIHRWLR